MRGLARCGAILMVVLLLAGAPARADSSPELSAWTAIQQKPTDAALVDFLVKYPRSPFRGKAAAMLADLRDTSPADVLDQYGGSSVPQSASAVPESASAAPAPADESDSPKLVGIFTRGHQEKYDDNSGYFEWEDELVLNADGTADLTVKHTEHLRSDPFFALRGCRSGTNYSMSPRVGTYRWQRKYTVTVAATTVSLQPQGPAEVSWIDPYCWQPNPVTGDDNTWVLNLVDGRLSDDDGAYVRKR